jgi:hypothetical protein
VVNAVQIILKTTLAKLKRWPRQRWHNGYWFLALLSLLPALRADLLFPHTWLTGLSAIVLTPASEDSPAQLVYLLPPVDSPFNIETIWIIPVLTISILALVTAALAFITSQRWRLLTVIPFILFGSTYFCTGVVLAGVSTAYVVSTLLVYLYFILVGRTLSLPFGSFLGLLLVLQMFDPQLAWPQILVFVAASLALSLVVEAIRQNLPLARQLGKSNFQELFVRTCTLWWPMLILIAIGLWLGHVITTSTEQLLYDRGYVTAYCNYGKDVNVTSDMREPFHCRNTGVEEWNNFSQNQLPFFDNLDLTVADHFSGTKTKLTNKIRAIKKSTVNSEDKAEKAARDMFEAVVPVNTGMTTSKCHFPDVACPAANIVIVGLNRAYDNARRDSKDKFGKEMRSYAVKGKEKVNKFTDKANTEMVDYLNAFETLTRQTIDRVHTAANLLQWLLWLWLLVMTIKSFLYVYARVIFDKATDIEVDLLEGNSVSSEGKVSHLQEVNIPGGYPYDLYYKSNYQPLGPAPRFSIPQCYRSILARLRNGAWNMSWVDLPVEDKRGVTFSSIEGEHIIDWEMAEGEEVIFNYHNFIAINENVELRTVISLRVATLLLGRMIFHTARCTKGPGRLLLRTRGKPATAEQVRHSIPSARLIAWNRYARFSVDSHLTPVDIFLNGFNLRRSEAEDEHGPQGILIVEADARDGGIFVGTLRFAKNFLLPV